MMSAESHTTSLSLGAGPSEENVAQVGTPGYREQAERECRAFICQILRKHGEPLPAGVRLIVEWSDHDFGSYAEVSVRFDEMAVDQAMTAYALERQSHMEWDEQAREQLGLVAQP